MHKRTPLTVLPEDRTRLEAVIAHRSSPQKHVWRCRIVLLSGGGLGTMAIVAAVISGARCNTVADFDIRLSPNIKTVLRCQNTNTSDPRKGIKLLS